MFINVLAMLFTLLTKNKRANKTTDGNCIARGVYFYKKPCYNNFLVFKEIYCNVVFLLYIIVLEELKNGFKERC